jgi:hypothetical protein
MSPREVLVQRLGPHGALLHELFAPVTGDPYRGSKLGVFLPGESFPQMPAAKKVLNDEQDRLYRSGRWLFP